MYGLRCAHPSRIAAQCCLCLSKIVKYLHSHFCFHCADCCFVWRVAWGMSRNNVLLQQNICYAMICLRSEEFLIYANICHALANLKRNKWTIISGACTITTQFKPAKLQIRYSCKSPNSGRLTNVQQNSFLRDALTCVYQTGLPFCSFW